MHKNEGLSFNCIPGWKPGILCICCTPLRDFLFAHYSPEFSSCHFQIQVICPLYQGVNTSGFWAFLRFHLHELKPLVLGIQHQTCIHLRWVQQDIPKLGHCTLLSGFYGSKLNFPIITNGIDKYPSVRNQLRYRVDIYIQDAQWPDLLLHILSLTLTLFSRSPWS